MTILALDLGTTTGWATLASSGHIVHGWASFKPGRYEGGGMRYLRFSRWLDSMAIETTISEVAFEEVRRHAGTDAAHVYGGFLAMLTGWCEERRIPYRGIPVGTIKRHVTGKGNADKAAVIAAVKALGHPVSDDNEADAVALLRYVMSLGVGQDRVAA